MICKITVKGAVQGVGYRPFILKKATEYGLQGFVRNIGAAVDILVKGEEETILKFTEMIKGEYPSGAFILSVEKCELSEDEYESYKSSFNIETSDKFEIVVSKEIDLSNELPVFLPDIGICPDCMAEMLNPKDRRYHYPLISCASCGPRISILNKLPYDRDTTTMIDFDMCPDCQREYILGRRRHAQTISCHDCGPQYELMYLSKVGEDDNSDCTPIDINKIMRIYNNENVISNAISLLKRGEIIGLKGSSGYQLVCKAELEPARNLRIAKGRENKPFAIMFSDVEAASKFCFINDKEKELLESLARPIVLLNTKKTFDYEVCRDSRYIGAFLPSVGIHRLLCDAAGPLIVTSANRSDEPIIIDDDKFIEEFTDRGVSAVLYHKRRINMPQDDSVMFVVDLQNNRYLPLFNRRARGFAPLPLFICRDNSSLNEEDKNQRFSKILSFGGDLKSTFSLGYKDKIIPSQYLGDLKDYGVNDNFQKLIDSFESIFEFKPEKIVCDMHPLYESVRLAKEYANMNNLPLFEVQHHHAHILSVMAEKSLKSCIGVSFDGTGYGTDGNIWGGEFLLCNGPEFERCAHLSYIKLCGGDNASKNAKLVKECYYNAAGLDKVPGLVKAALDNNVNVFNTSSVGRLFDSICALLEIKEENSFEGECAIALEKEAWSYFEHNKEAALKEDFYKLSFKIIEKDGVLLPDQASLFTDICIAYSEKKIPKDELAYAFHMALVDGIVSVCECIRASHNESKVCLSGGVFGNRLLLSNAIKCLENKGFEVYVNELVPAGDAGISVGQAYYLMLKED